MSMVRDITVVSIAAKDIYQDIFLFPAERKAFLLESGTLILPVYFYRVIGIEQNSEDEYYNVLYNLDLQLKKAGSLYQKIDTRLDTHVPDDIIQRVNTIWNEIKADSNLRAPYISANFFGAGLLKLTGDPNKDLLIKNSFQQSLELFISIQKQPKSPGIIKNLCIKLLYWFEKHALQLFKSCSLERYNPKILYYGDIKRDETVFLIFLSRLGFDILYFNPGSDGSFNEIDPDFKYSTKLEFEEKRAPQPFPAAEKHIIVETVAFQVEKNIENDWEGNTRFIKPWQFEAYEVKTLTLKTTYDELVTLWSCEARNRAGFKVSNNTICLPNLFAKVNGVNAKLQTYWANMTLLLKEKNEFIHIIDRIPFTTPAPKSFDYRTLMQSNGFFDKDKVKNCQDYSLSYLKTSLQNTMLDKVNEIIRKECFHFAVDTNIKTKMLSTILNLDKEILKILQRFDYPFIVPKILIYHNTDKSFSVEDYITLAFLNAIGCDIVIFTPSGYSNIENGLKVNLFDVHNLEEVNFDLPVAKEVRSLFKGKTEGMQDRLIDKLKTWLK